MKSASLELLWRCDAELGDGFFNAVGLLGGGEEEAVKAFAITGRIVDRGAVVFYCHGAVWRQ